MRFSSPFLSSWPCTNRPSLQKSLNYIVPTRDITPGALKAAAEAAAKAGTDAPASTSKGAKLPTHAELEAERAAEQALVDAGASFYRHRRWHNADARFAVQLNR